MRYKSSNIPTYTVMVKSWDETHSGITSKKEEFLDWAMKNDIAPFMLVQGGGGSQAEILTTPSTQINQFGEKNDFSRNREPFTTMISFSRQQDLTAFMLYFENT